MDLAGVLETVLYCSTENEDETRRFYREVLGLKPFRSARRWATRRARRWNGSDLVRSTIAAKSLSSVNVVRIHQSIMSLML